MAGARWPPVDFREDINGRVKIAVDPAGSIAGKNVAGGCKRTNNRIDRNNRPDSERTSVSDHSGSSDVSREGPGKME